MDQPALSHGGYIGEDAGGELGIAHNVIDRVDLDPVECPAENRIDGLHHADDLNVREFVVPPKLIVKWTWPSVNVDFGIARSRFPSLLLDNFPGHDAIDRTLLHIKFLMRSDNRELAELIVPYVLHEIGPGRERLAAYRALKTVPSVGVGVVLAQHHVAVIHGESRSRGHASVLRTGRDVMRSGHGHRGV